MRNAAVVLREIQDADLPIIFAHQADRRSNVMAGVPARPRADFDAHWKKIRADPSVILRVIIEGKKLAGYAGSFVRDEKREVCYWLGREFWGKGIAGRALGQFLEVDHHRPLHARVSKDNAPSIRVLEKNGFKLEREDVFKDRNGKEDVGFLFILTARGK